MAYTYNGFNPYGMNGMQPPMQYGQAMPDQLAQLRQMQQAQPMQMQQMPQPVPNDMIWVQGEAAAKAYMVMAGSKVILWDSENPTIYIKSVDANGIPTIKILDYEERAEAPQMPSGGRRRTAGEFVTRAEFEAAMANLAAQMKGGEQNAESAV